MEFQKSKMIYKGVEGAQPVVLVWLLMFLNKKFNLCVDEETIIVAAGSISAGYFSVKNWIKQKIKK